MAAVSTITNNADLEKAGIHCGTSNNENHEHAELSTPEESDVAEDGAPLEKVKSVNSISSIPNGGLRAWLVVVGSFFLFFNSWGISNTFGVYQTYYESNLLSSSSPSSISWIGSIQPFLLMVISAISGPIYDAGFSRALVFSGSCFVILGTFMLSICKEYWQVLLAQGICTGLGAGLLFVPSVAIISTYFTTKLATAVGIAACGSSVGGVVYPLIFTQLEPKIGFSWMTRIIAFIVLATQIIPNTVMKVRVRPAQRRKMIDWSAFREVPYVLFVAGGFLGFMALYVPFFYIQLYSLERNIASESLTFYILPIINGASIFGRIFPNMLADKIGPFNMIVPCGIISGILVMSLISVSSLAGILTFCILFGFFSGTFVSLPPTVFVALSPNRSIVGTRMGMGFAIVAFSLLTGTPIAGAILKQSSAGFMGVWVFAGCLIVGGSALMGIARGAKVGWRITSKG